MARCPKLDYVGGGGLFNPTKEYECSLTGVKMYEDDSKVKFVCNSDNSCAYENCPIYQNR